LHPYNTATDTSSFALSDAGGWDECLPSIAACNFGGVEIPDHGDVWRRPWTAVVKNDAILAHVNSFSVPLRFSRWVSLDGPTMHLRYAVTNTGREAADFLWSAHPLFQVQEGDRIVQLARGGHVDLSSVGRQDGITSHKLFAGPLSVGWCGLYRAELKLGIVMRFDPGQTPFAGLWISHGAWPPHGLGARQYTVALEPTMAPCDALDRAVALGHAPHLLPQAEFSWPMQFEIFGSHEPVGYQEFLALASTPPRH
jgi:hypothetical protein